MATITLGQTVNLLWYGIGVTQFVASASPAQTDWIGNVATPTGSKTVTPVALGTIVYTLTDSASEVSDSVTVTVNPAPTASPTPTATTVPTASPTPTATAVPTASPSASPTTKPTATPTGVPTVKPTPTSTRTLGNGNGNGNTSGRAKYVTDENVPVMIVHPVNNKTWMAWTATGALFLFIGLGRIISSRRRRSSQI